jgi:hypothetical protein
MLVPRSTTARPGLPGVRCSGWVTSHAETAVANRQGHTIVVDSVVVDLDYCSTRRVVIPESRCDTSTDRP